MITDLQASTYDYDWFAVDAAGEVSHFATGAMGFLPQSVMKDDHGLQVITEYFRDVRQATSQCIVSPEQLSVMQGWTPAQVEKSLRDFSQMASKGLYSFDCVEERATPTGYYLVCKPEVGVRIESLPEEIQRILGRTRFTGQFASTIFVRESDVT